MLQGQLCRGQAISGFMLPDPGADVWWQDSEELLQDHKFPDLLLGELIGTNPPPVQAFEAMVGLGRGLSCKNSGRTELLPTVYVYGEMSNFTNKAAFKSV